MRGSLLFLARRAPKMRAVGIFCLASMIVSIFEWFGGGILTFFPLVSGRSEGGGDFLVIPLLTYALIHWSLIQLFVSFIGIALLGCLLEAKIGSKTTGLLIVTGVVLTGLAWKFLMPSQRTLIGSAGVTYAMAGGLVRVGPQSWTGMGRGERVLLAVAALWTVIMLVSDLRSSLVVGIIPCISMSAGYVVLVCRQRDKGSRTRATDDEAG